ncbi:MAG: glycosyltransferase family 1 protein [Gammaproteobacteria bacterium]|nr:glycosyltransferase family 1 protein [Gammaproteobacteria bacterium]
MAGAESIQKGGLSDGGMNIACVTDAWKPQVNGVVRTLETVAREAEALGHRIHIIHPGQFRTLPCPGYPEIRLAAGCRRELGRRLEALGANRIHIATEGPLGLAARRWCLRNKQAFTTSLHTRFPEYLHARCRLPLSWGWKAMRWFHGPARGVMVATPSLKRELRERGITNTRSWMRGVDTKLFRPGLPVPAALGDLPRPILLCVGRVSVEKNLPAFLELECPGSKVVVGDGPRLEKYRARYPQALFTGAKFGDDLAACYAAADIFVFPSRTDTFGLVMLEALACGTPVAAFPVPGPQDVLRDPRAASMDSDLSKAAARALTLDRGDCRRYAEQFGWERCARRFVRNLSP